jgi:hypothetical protein
MSDVNWTSDDWDLERVAALARFAHMGQRDKGGKPYIGHVTRVSQAVEREARRRGWSASDILTAKKVALLHDVLEDTPFTAGMLQDLGMPIIILIPVMLLTREAWRPDEVYYAHIKENPIALLVKEMDIEDHLDPDRLSLLDEADRVRLSERKYPKARRMLGLEN